MRKAIIIEVDMPESMSPEQCGDEVYDRLESMFGGEVNLQYILPMATWMHIAGRLLAHDPEARIES